MHCDNVNSAGRARDRHRRVPASRMEERTVAQAEVPDFDKRLATFASATFMRLRPGQSHVLAAYAEHHLDTADLAIEMPTGEGKTLLALLIADYALDQGRSVGYLTGTRQLAERVQDEASKLGLDVVRFAAKDYGGAKLDDYHQAQAVGVMNYWVYFNSKPVPQPADLVIFDDAHLAEQPLSGLQTLRLPNKQGPARSLYRTICDLVVAHTDAYAGLQAMRDGTARPGTPPELLSFSDWAAIVTAVRDAIETSPLVRRGDQGRNQVGMAENPCAPHLVRSADRAVGDRDPSVPPADSAQRGLQPGQPADLPLSDARVDGRPAASCRRRSRHPAGD